MAKLMGDITVSIREYAGDTRGFAEDSREFAEDSRRIRERIRDGFAKVRDGYANSRIEPWAATAGSARVCMMERKKGSDLESWGALGEDCDWGTLGQGYHWTDLRQGFPLVG